MKTIINREEALELSNFLKESWFGWEHIRKQLVNEGTVDHQRYIDEVLPADMVIKYDWHNKTVKPHVSFIRNGNNIFHHLLTKILA